MRQRDDATGPQPGDVGSTQQWIDRFIVLDHVLRVMGTAHVARASWGGVNLPLWIVKSVNPDLAETRCIMTAGVSSIQPLTWARTQQPASRQEFAMIVRDEQEHRDEVTDALTALAVAAVEEHTVFDRRLIYERVNRPATSRLTHAMVVNGSPLPSELGDVGGGHDFAVEWILPLSRIEADYGRSKGASRLMFLLRWSDVDMFDLNRDSAQVPAEITVKEFATGGDAGDPDEVYRRILGLIEGEPERNRVVDALLSMMRSVHENVRHCATEAIEALALTEPESFSNAQADAAEALLVNGLDLGVGVPAEEDALDAIRHARQHIVTS